jgi:hypothetical protein
MDYLSLADLLSARSLASCCNRVAPFVAPLSPHTFFHAVGQLLNFIDLFDHVHRQSTWSRFIDLRFQISGQRQQSIRICHKPFLSGGDPLTPAPSVPILVLPTTSISLLCLVLLREVQASLAAEPGCFSHPVERKRGAVPKRAWNKRSIYRLQG